MKENRKWYDGILKVFGGKPDTKKESEESGNRDEEKEPEESGNRDEEKEPEESGSRNTEVDRRNRNVNIREVNELITDLRENLGEACLSTAIISYETGSSIASYQMDDKSAALLSKFTTFMVEMIDKAAVDGKIQYYASKLPGPMMSFTLVFKGYCWLIIVNTAQVPLGMIMNGVLPECIENFQVVIA